MVVAAAVATPKHPLTESHLVGPIVAMVTTVPFESLVTTATNSLVILYGCQSVPPTTFYSEWYLCYPTTETSLLPTALQVLTRDSDSNGLGDRQTTYRTAPL